VLRGPSSAQFERPHPWHLREAPDRCEETAEQGCLGDDMDRDAEGRPRRALVVEFVLRPRLVVARAIG
jgi:hypothetical protein